MNKIGSSTDLKGSLNSKTHVQMTLRTLLCVPMQTMIFKKIDYDNLMRTLICPKIIYKYKQKSPS
jgi:hypothetical protein